MIFVGKNRIHYQVVDSTNEELKRLFSEGETEEGTLVTAGFQEGGKGQMGAGWLSEPDQNFLGTYFLKPNIELEEVFALNMVVSLAVREAVEEFVKGKVEIKWPNDIVVDGKKISGVLIENKLFKGELLGVFTGIGLNVNQVSFPELKRTCTSLSLEIGADIDLEVVTSRLSFHLQQFLSLFETKGFASISYLYHQELYQKGEEHPYKVGKDTRYFTLQAVDKLGDLQLYNQFGKLESFALKQIEFL